MAKGKKKVKELFLPIGIARQREYFQAAYPLVDWGDPAGLGAWTKWFWGQIINKITVQQKFPATGVYPRGSTTANRRLEFRSYWRSLLCAMIAVLNCFEPEDDHGRLLKEMVRRELPLTRQWLFVVTGDSDLARHDLERDEIAVLGDPGVPEAVTPVAAEADSDEEEEEDANA